MYQHVPPGNPVHLDAPATEQGTSVIKTANKMLKFSAAAAMAALLAGAAQGQGVPVGVGQPSLRIDRLTVGGTAA